ncbi:MurR/RpiR family transcriptional regulator [Advenella mimigardefordensis]|uniref:Transcriptional regulator, RpiR family n=1 Tax=Advenella mimigardefordensis (strain DSM 17166 / LMG 22922 / DPN7) TaxID=1247726 RepID=W0PI65_ADVMD|nr:MurR/RpiR family transcriptional regulator [Advenella mimigardefordensis]AHG64618.1 transcriptional regulator, RpiR family [Advenella mimigardefordensis DPN7]
MTAENFLNTLANQYSDLPKQLKVIATFVESHQDEIPVLRVQDIAQACSVQSSAVVRFAQRFGFKGYSEMQAVFTDQLLTVIPKHQQYRDRVRQELSGDNTHDSLTLTDKLVSNGIKSLEDLQSSLDQALLDNAATALAQARKIYIAGMGRSLPIASYLVYALQNLEREVVFLNGLGGVPEQYMRTMNSEDVLLAISFAPYAEQTQTCLRHAKESGASIVLISDAALSPISHFTHLLLCSTDIQTLSFRTLTATMCLAQILFLSLAYKLETTQQDK